MAHINKVNMIRNLTGMNSHGHQKGIALAAGPDNIPAMIHNQQGIPVQPAAIKQGEIIFSVEAVIGAGNGDYDKGSKFLLALHEKLKQHGEQIAQQSQGGTLQGSLNNA